MREVDVVGVRVEMPSNQPIVLLREVEGLPYEDIAGILGMNLGTLKATLHRTRERLRRELIRQEVTP